MLKITKLFQKAKTLQRTSQKKKPWWWVAALRFGVVLAVVACSGQAAFAIPIGVSSFTYDKDGVKIEIGLDDILKVLDPQPATGLIPPIAVNFSETIDNFSLKISGGDFDTDSTQTLAFDGAYWDGTIGISQDSGFLFDFLSFSGNFSHAVGRHGETDNPSMQFKSPVGIPNPLVFTRYPDGVVKHGNDHPDKYTGFVDATFFLTDITSWNMVLEARHPVPEPASLILLCAGLVALAEIRRKRLHYYAASFGG